METFKLCSLLVTCYLVSHRVAARPEGPPTAACTLLGPLHGNPIIRTQSGTSGATLEGLGALYEPGNTFEFTIMRPDIPFRGFIIQARASEVGEPFGVFIDQNDGKQRTMECTSADDTLSHMNRDNVTSVTVQWRADNIDASISSFNFYYSIVQNFSIFWERLPSSPIQVMRPIAQGDINYQLVKVHGAMMVTAWGLLAPVGILIAIFYKVVWPTGEWFYSHIGIMVGTMVLTIIGVVVIIIHAGGTWLTTTPANVPHQIMGILVCVALGVNPILAIFRCDPNNEWRAVFNWTHGIIGLIAGEGLALAAMMLGLHAFQELPGVYRDRVHIAIYMLSGVVGVFIMVLASYNLYAIMFKKYLSLEPDELGTTSSVPGNIPDKPFYSHNTEEEDSEPSRDYPLRAGLGIGIIVALCLLVLAAIALIASA